MRERYLETNPRIINQVISSTKIEIHNKRRRHMQKQAICFMKSITFNCGRLAAIF